MTTDHEKPDADEFTSRLVPIAPGKLSIEELVRETYAVHFVMWNAGVEDTTTAIRRIANAPVPGAPYVAVLGRRRGIEFLMHIAPVLGEAEQRAFDEAWTGFAARQPRMSSAERDQMVVGTLGLLNRGLLERALRTKGLID